MNQCYWEARFQHDFQVAPIQLEKFHCFQSFVEIKNIFIFFMPYFFNPVEIVEVNFTPKGKIDDSHK